MKKLIDKARCMNCQSVLISANARDEAGRRFCDDACMRRFQIDTARETLGAEEVTRLAVKLRNAGCPNCKKDLPVDVYPSWVILSIFFAVASEEKHHFMCRDCARRKQMLDLVACTVMGWWSFRGMLLTPFMIWRNAKAIREAPGASPSNWLEDEAAYRAFHDGTVEEAKQPDSTW